MNSIVLVSLGANRKQYPYQQHMTYVTSPGIRYVKAILQNNGFKTEIIDQPDENLDLDDIIKRIKNLDPDAVLFNQFFSTRKHVRNIIDTLQKKYVIGIGGHDVTLQADYLSNDELQSMYRDVDFLWRGEAESGLAEYLNAFQRTGKLSIVDNRQNRVQDLDTLPILSHDDYSGEIGFIVTARGCFSNGCDFCSTSRFYPDGWRCRSTKHVEQELLNLKKNNKNYIVVFDDNFFGFNNESMERGASIIDRCRELDIKIVFLMASVNQVNDLKEKGYLERFRGTLNNVLLGIENVNEKALNVLGKRCNIKNHERSASTAIEALHSHGISMMLGYINFNPFSTLEELENNARFLHENHYQAAQFQYLSKKMQLFEGTRFFDNYMKDNDLSGNMILDAEYIYDFKDTRVGNAASIIKLVQNEAVLFDCIDLEVSTLLHMNQLQDGDFGVEYAAFRKDVSDMNFEFFMKLLYLCKNDGSAVVGIIGLLNNYKDKYKKNIGRAKELYLKIFENSRYKLLEPAEYVSKIDA